MAMKQGGARKNMAQVAKELEDKLLRNHNVCLVFSTAGIGLMVAEVPTAPPPTRHHTTTA